MHAPSRDEEKGELVDWSEGTGGVAGRGGQRTRELVRRRRRCHAAPASPEKCSGVDGQYRQAQPLPLPARCARHRQHHLVRHLA
eukprot:6197630-Pleurochrysis_carterae.AAC.2